MANVVKIEGLEELKGQVQVLSPKGQRRVWRNAFRGAAQKQIRTPAAKNLRGQGHRALAKDVVVKASATDANVSVRVGGKKHTRLASIGHFLEKGTPPHVIRVRNKKALSASAQGPVFGRIVNHPGMKPMPWLLELIPQQKDKVAEDIAGRITAEVAKARAKGL